MLAAIWAAPRAVELAESIRNTAVSGVHGRLVESFAVPAAMHAVLMHGRDVSREVAVETLRRMIGGRAALIGQGERDEVQLLRDILSSTVRVPETGPSGTGTVHVERTVAQILATADTAKRAAFAEHAEFDGADNRGGHGRPALQARTAAINSGSSSPTTSFGDRLLRDTRWAESRIDQILSRLAGAERGATAAGRDGAEPGLSLPWAGCLTELGGRDSECDNGNA